MSANDIPEATAAFMTPQAVTTTIKRALRGQDIDVLRVNTGRCTNGYLTMVSMYASASDALYDKAATVLADAGFKVTAHRSTDWISVSSNYKIKKGSNDNA